MEKGEWYKDKGKCINKSRIEFPEILRGNRGKYYFSPFWFLIQKLDHNSALHAKNQREISNNKVRRLLWPLGGGKCGKGGGNGIRRGGNALQNPELSFPTQY